MNERLAKRLSSHLTHLYPEADVQALAQGVAEAFWPQGHAPRTMPRGLDAGLWSEKDALLITYGDSVLEEGKAPLQSLKDFVDAHLKGVINGVHVLPFFPFSSDDGFSVMDYEAVRPDLGDWPHIAAIAENYRLMSDLVINHASAEGVWFKAYREGVPEFANWFAEASPEDDLSQVVRPRSTPLLTPYETSDGEKHLWCTFSPDQVDLNFRNPKVLLAFVKLMRFYIDHGVRIFRLDAVAFLWKVVGSSSINLPETHEVVRLLRTLCDFEKEPVLLITETNVPNNENLSYFGNQNEAHVIYNFSLPPLIVHALLSGSAAYLRRFMMGMPPCQDSCTFLNFTASHDGIGLRPAEGLLPQAQIDEMIETVKRVGGRVSMRATREGGDKPYEMNITLFEAMKGTFKGVDDLQFERFIASQTMAMALEGIPAFYIHSLLATKNDEALFAVTGHNRSLNRSRLQRHEIESALKNPETDTARVLTELKRRLTIRQQQTAFHPNAVQFTLQLPPSFFGVWRQSMSRRQSIFAITNVTDEPQKLALTDINLIYTSDWVDLLSGEGLDNLEEEIVVAPYQTLWISNRT